MSDELSIAKQSSGSVVVGVEECQGFLLENEEDGVNEFEVLGQVVHLPGLVLRCYSRLWFDTHIIQCDKRLGPATVVAADCVEHASVDQSGQQLLNKE